MPLLALPMVFSLGCRRDQGQRNERPPVSVTVATAARRSLPLELRTIGTVEPLHTVAVRAQVSGVLMRVGFREGDEVSAGQLLFQIDPRPFRAALLQAQANLARDRAQADNAAAQAKRYRQLVDNDYVTREQYDQARTGAEALAATVKSDEQSVESARLSLEYASLRSPLAGRTGSLLTKPGNLVRAGDVTPLVVIHQLRPIQVSFSLPEQHLAAIRERAARAPLPVRAVPSRDHRRASQGRLRFIDNQVDAASGTILLRAEFANQDSALWPGQFVDVFLGLGSDDNALVVPSQAIQTGQQGTYLFVLLPGGTVDKRDVVVTREADGLALIASGLADGQQVVTDGQMRLRSGTRVVVRGAASAAGATPAAAVPAGTPPTGAAPAGAPVDRSPAGADAPAPSAASRGSSR